MDPVRRGPTADGPLGPWVRSTPRYRVHLSHPPHPVDQWGPGVPFRPEGPRPSFTWWPLRTLLASWPLLAAGTLNTLGPGDLGHLPDPGYPLHQESPPDPEFVKKAPRVVSTIFTNNAAPGVTSNLVGGRPDGIGRLLADKMNDMLAWPRPPSQPDAFSKITLYNQPSSAVESNTCVSVESTMRNIAASNCKR